MEIELYQMLNRMPLNKLFTLNFGVISRFCHRKDERTRELILKAYFELS
jgi:hypothetical protein